MLFVRIAKLLSIALAMLFNGALILDAQTVSWNANKSLFADLYDSNEQMVIIVHSVVNCKKCALKASDISRDLKKKNVTVKNVLILNRLSDSIAYKHYLDVDDYVFRSRSSFHTWDVRFNEDAWYYYHLDSAKLGFCSLTTEDSGKLLYNLCTEAGELQKRLAVNKLAELDESGGALINPNFNPYIRDSIVIAGSDGSLHMDAFNIYSGKRVWKVTLPETLFLAALNDGEVLERDVMLYMPGIIAAEWLGRDTVLAVGRIVSRRYDSIRMAPMIGRRDFISAISVSRNEPYWVRAPRDICSGLSVFTMLGAQSRFPYLYTSQCPWSYRGDSIYLAPTISVTNMISGEMRLSNILDSAYRILDIGDNLGSGYSCVQNGEIWTGQPLRPYFENVETKQKIWLKGNAYDDYYNKLKRMSENLGQRVGTTFQRCQQFRFESVVTGIFSLEKHCIAVMTYETDSANGSGDWLSVYDIRNGGRLVREEVRPGWTLQTDNNELVRVELTEERYEIIQYELE